MVQTVHLRGYDDIIHVGHLFCHDFPVLMDLTTLSDEDAQPAVDFAAGLIVGRGGDLERVAARVFLLRPGGGAASAPA
jgi:cell division inhibitor SepF